MIPLAAGYANPGMARREERKKEKKKTRFQRETSMAYTTGCRSGVNMQVMSEPPCFLFLIPPSCRCGPRDGPIHNVQARNDLTLSLHST